MDIDYKLIGRRISDIRKESGITQEDLAEICDVSSRFISYVENGRKRASLKVLAAISEELSVTMDELVFGPVNAAKSQAEDWGDIILDCDRHEREFMIETAGAMKKAIRRHRLIL